MTADALGSDLRRLVGSDAIMTDKAARVLAGTDFITQRGIPAVVARPTSSDQVVALLRYASEHGLRMVPRGAATNLSGAIAPGDESLVLDLTGMNRILEIDAQARRAVVEPGVINADLKAAAAPAGLVYAPDPASTPISTIGGNIAENAGGPGCIKHGVTFHHVLGLDVVLADGRLVTFTDDDEVDLLGVVIGSEGILGVVTRAVLKLMPIPAVRWTALAAFDRVEDAALAVSEIIAAGILPAALELCDQRFVEIMEAHLPSGYPTDKAAMLIVELDGEPDDIARETPALEKLFRRWDPTLRTAVNEQQRTALWAGRLAAGFAIRATGKAFYICDSTVPRQRIPEMMARSRQIAASYGLDVPVVGHAGDGNLHPTILYEPAQLAIVEGIAEEIADAALALGGTLTGEHGIGTAKRAQMRKAFGAVELAAFRAIKRAFDPDGLLNPGVMLPSQERDEPDLKAFGDTVKAALDGRPTALSPVLQTTHDREVHVDIENMSLAAGGAALCRDVAAAARAVGLSCPAMEIDGVVGDNIEGAGHRRPARSALLGVEATLPGGYHATFGSAAMKDVAGLDAKRLIAGGRGAFGRVERVNLRATPHRS
ncbi:FAD-linked oxidase C-terminal domain-containing protein [Mycobacterium sp. NPDC050041]|uniref:FAD-binding oxidoreductase n=1 Tax=Mycobacterium sp. NPDC050041 TaxID=3364293 RepID=UPI003C2AE898